MRVLTTGGTGFIGKAVLDNLLENIEKVEILNLTRSISKRISAKVEFFNCDLSNPNTYLNKVIDFKPDVVIHLAWEGIPDFSFEKCTKNILISTSFIENITKIKSCKKIIGRYKQKILIELSENSKDAYNIHYMSVIKFLKKYTNPECEELKISFQAEMSSFF